VLGYLDADFFLGGKMKLDKAAAEKAIADGVGKPLRLETLRAAWGIHDIICEDVARAFRIHATERGFDYRNSSMVAFGGSGPLHALSVARKLKIPRVVLPVGAGVMSALGLLVSPLAFEVARSRRIHVADTDAKDFAASFAALENEAAGYLRRAGVAEADIKIVRHLDMRYQGQGHEIEVTLPPARDVAGIFADLGELYGHAYEKTYGLRLDEPTEIVNWKVEAAGPTPTIAEGYGGAAAGSADRALKGPRQAYDPLSGGLAAWPVYDRYALVPGATVQGPALIEEHESTCVIGPGDAVTVDARFNLIAELSA
jgi:N-methylhydantoinase A